MYSTKLLVNPRSGRSKLMTTTVTSHDDFYAAINSFICSTLSSLTHDTKLHAPTPTALMILLPLPSCFLSTVSITILLFSSSKMLYVILTASYPVNRSTSWASNWLLLKPAASQQGGALISSGSHNATTSQTPSSMRTFQL